MNEQKRMVELAGINEATAAPKFKLPFPKDIDGLTMRFLYLGIGNATLNILADIEKRTGSNANPISLQVTKGGLGVQKSLEKKMSLTGKEALDYFMSVALKEFNTDAPFISKLFKKYKLNRMGY